MASDWELLDQYAAGKDQEAFAELVRRHVDLVYGVALRAGGGTGRDAEDVVQAVFLLLSQKAGRIPRRGVLAGWLFRATRYCCADVKKSEGRRRRREREAAMERSHVTAEGSEGSGFEGLRVVLDEALGRLGEKERAAILVRYLEGKSVAQTGAMLGISAEAVEKRLERGVGKLRGIFARKGFVVPAASVAAVMIAESAKATPVGLAASAAGVTGGASVTAVGIAKGAAVMMKVAMAKVAAVLIVGTVVVVGVGVAAENVAEQREVVASTEVSGAVNPSTRTGGNVSLDELSKRYADIFNALDEKKAGTSKLDYQMRALQDQARAEGRQMGPGDDFKINALQTELMVALWNKIESAAKEVAMKHGTNAVIPENVPTLPKDLGGVRLGTVVKIIHARMVIPLDEGMAGEVVKILNERYAKESARAENSLSAGDREKLEIFMGMERGKLIYKYGGEAKAEEALKKEGSSIEKELQAIRTRVVVQLLEKSVGTQPATRPMQGPSKGAASQTATEPVRTR